MRTHFQKEVNNRKRDAYVSLTPFSVSVYYIYFNKSKQKEVVKTFPVIEFKTDSIENFPKLSVAYSKSCYKLKSFGYNYKSTT